MRKFTRILNRHHPALVDRLKVLHNSSFIQRNCNTKYLSSHNRTFQQAEKPTKLTRSSWSLINLTKFTKEAEKYSIDQMDDLEQEPNPLARSNSFNTRLELVGARQRRPFKESAQRQSNNATAAAVAEAPARHSRKSSDNPFHNANSETESTCSEYEEVDETDEFQYQDVSRNTSGYWKMQECLTIPIPKYLTENDQATLKETIKNFFDSKVDNRYDILSHPLKYSGKH